MVLSRTWYNTLVDDDGSGMTGSVWDKGDVDSLMDAIDAELSRLDGGVIGGYSQGVWTPSLIATGGGTGTYSVRSGTWGLYQNILAINGRLTLTSKGSLSGVLSITGAPYASNPSTQAAIAIPYWSGVLTNITAVGGITLGTSWGLYCGVAGQAAVAALDSTFITSSFDIIFGGCFLKQ